MLSNRSVLNSKSKNVPPKTPTVPTIKILHWNGQLKFFTQIIMFIPNNFLPKNLWQSRTIAKAIIYVDPLAKKKTGQDQNVLWISNHGKLQFLVYRFYLSTWTESLNLFGFKKYQKYSRSHWLTTIYMKIFLYWFNDTETMRDKTWLCGGVLSNRKILNM